MRQPDKHDWLDDLRDEAERLRPLNIILSKRIKRAVEEIEKLRAERALGEKASES
jgi:hypothetical protein